MAANMAAAAAEAKGALVTRSEHEQKYDRQTRCADARASEE
jgi:hypothetical protein